MRPPESQPTACLVRRQEVAHIQQALYPDDVDRETLADEVGSRATSGGFKNNLGRMRSLGLIDYPERGRVAATELLFPEGL